jgi:ATP-dependent Clp protease protease subunit
MHKPPQLSNNMRPTPKLLQLMLDNLETPRTFKVEQSADGSEATVYVYDVIDSYLGISAADFVKELAALSAPTIHLRINSPGGDVFDARAMATAVRGHPSKIIAHVDGMALSAATTLAIAAAETEMAEGSFFMIHNAWSWGVGNANDLMELAALLEKIDGALVADYTRKTKQTAEQIVAWMAAETWFTAQEAVDAGFADRVFKGAEAAAKNRWDVADIYAKTPKVLTEKKPEPAPDPLLVKRAEFARRLNLYQRT